MMALSVVAMLVACGVALAYKPIIMMHGLAFDPYHGNHHVR